MPVTETVNSMYKDPFLPTDGFHPDSMQNRIRLQLEAGISPDIKAYTPCRYTPVSYILDYVQGKYLYIDEACYHLFGYTAKYYLEEGMKGYENKWHPADYEVVHNKVFPKNRYYLQTITTDRYANLIFSCNYRVRHANGQYVSILQRWSYLPGIVPGIPAGAIGTTVDISHFKSDASIVHTIEEATSTVRPVTHTLLYKSVYAINETVPSVISPREVEVLHQMAKGLSSKQIAEHLHLSINTVNNHRKNMLNKTGCKNATELLNYALKHGYL